LKQKSEGRAVNWVSVPWFGGAEKITKSGHKVYLPDLQNSHFLQGIPGSKATLSPII